MPVHPGVPGSVAASPFLKWAGGKARLLPELVRIYRATAPHGRYHEPFLGGGALFFGLVSEGLLVPGRAVLSDCNPHLIEAYRAVQDRPEALIGLLEEHQACHGTEHYALTRATVPDEAMARAARLIYLNRTCFNGLYRENSGGGFNVPMGRYSNPRIADRARIEAASRALAAVTLSCRHFADVEANVGAGDFVYFDPPYHPLSRTSSFTRYVGLDFGEEQQVALRDLFALLDRRGATVLLSNSDCPFIRDLYRDWPMRTVGMPRAINARSSGRGDVAELLVCNRRMFSPA
ncbi:MAG: DNA adenine methylase [Candidatus Sericytochromatia bacterium]|nr:DNA adenine methylase [Candidatus Tanganyikabacteria bacterium]